jgi:hypothetical protein
MSNRPILTKKGVVETKPAQAAPEGNDVSRGEHTAPTPELNPRNIAMAEIAARYEEKVKAEAAETIVDSIDDDGNYIEGKAQKPDEQIPASTQDDKTDPEQDKEPEQEEVTAEAEEDQQEQEQETADKNDAFDPDGDYEITVDGVKVKVKGAQILAAGVANLQKNSAADMRLEAATRMLQEASEKLKSVQPSPKKDVEKETSGDSQPSDEDVALARAIQFGSEEDAVKAIAKLRTTGRGQSPEEVVGFVTGKIGPMVSDHLAYTKARDFVVSEYPEVFGNPMLKNLFINEEARMRDVEKDARPYHELYPAIAEGIIKALNIPRQKKTDNSVATPTSTDRVIRKAKAASAVVSGSGGIAPKPEITKPMTTKEYVEQQRRARGM